MSLSLDETLQFLRPHRDALFMFPKKAFELYQTLSPEVLLHFGKRTRASAVHDLMLKEAARYADRAEGVRWFKVNQLHGLVINEQIAIRFKKFDSRIIPSNIRTQQVVSFRSQCHIEGIDAIHHLEVGYNLDSLEKEIAEVFVVNPSGFKSNFWAYKITESEVKPIVENIFSDHSDDTIQPAIIKPKQGAIILPFKNEGRGGFSDDENKR